MSQEAASALQSTTAVLTVGERRHIAAMTLVRDHIGKNFRPGQHLPGGKAMAVQLGLPLLHVATVLKALNSSGELYVSTGVHGPRVLMPDELHPDDIAFDAAVRGRIASEHYHFGQALPTGLLGVEFGLESDQVVRAFRHLVRDGLVHHDTTGPHGKGYYVARGSSPRPAATPQLLAAGRP
ncbi:hypothetical protein SAVIM338S_00783 [Streptomyces avidinii]